MKPSNELVNMVLNECARFGVDPSLVLGVIDKESSFNPSAVNPRDPSYGFMGIMLKTARGIDPTATKERLLSPSYNIEIGVRYLKILMNQYGSQAWDDILASYNSGKPYSKAPAVTRTSYIPYVVKRAQEYRQMLAQAVPGRPEPSFTSASFFSPAYIIAALVIGVFLLRR